MRGLEPNGAAFVSDRAPKPFNGSPQQYIDMVWTARAASQVEPLQVNGRLAASALAQARTGADSAKADRDVAALPLPIGPAP